MVANNVGVLPKVEGQKGDGSSNKHLEGVVVV
jgi:hypothetical protein